MGRLGGGGPTRQGRSADLKARGELPRGSVAAEGRRETSPAACDGIFRPCITALLGTSGYRAQCLITGGRCMENIRRHVPGDHWPGVASWQRCIQGVWTKVVHFFQGKYRPSEPQCTSMHHVWDGYFFWDMSSNLQCTFRDCHIFISLYLCFFGPGIDSICCSPPRCRSRSCLQVFDLL